MLSYTRIQCNAPARILNCDPSSSPCPHPWDSALFSAPQPSHAIQTRRRDRPCRHSRPNHQLNSANLHLSTMGCSLERPLFAGGPWRWKGTGKNMSIPRLGGSFPTFDFPSASRFARQSLVLLTSLAPRRPFAFTTIIMKSQMASVCGLASLASGLTTRPSMFARQEAASCIDCTIPLVANSDFANGVVADGDYYRSTKIASTAPATSAWSRTLKAPTSATFAPKTIAASARATWRRS